MNRHTLVLVLVVIIALSVCALLVASCGSGGSGGPGPYVAAVDINGTWNVYRTYTGKPERGPDAAQFNNILVAGYGAGMTMLCSSFVVPAGQMGISGELHDHVLTMSNVATSVSWTGTVSGSTISGTFSDPSGTGTWRAVRTATPQCKTYEVYGGYSYLPCGGVQGYDPASYGYTYLGSAVTTATFTGAYSYYTVVTRDFNVAHVDTVSGSTGTYFSTVSTGNTTSYTNVGGAPDGNYAVIGNGIMSQGGYIDIDASSSAQASIKVYLAP